MRSRAAGASVALLILAATVSAEAQEIAAHPTVCASPSLDRALTDHVRARHLLDAHGLAQVLLAMCPSSPLRFRWTILDALVLDDLDEPARAQALLVDAATTALSPDREAAATLLARSHLLVGDDRAFVASLDRLPPGAAARLRLFAARDDKAEFRRRIDSLGDRALIVETLNRFSLYDRAVHTRRPWLAGALSALLPGAGQIYAGSWQGAAVAFVLNAVLMGATAELVYRRLYVSAGAAGLAASIFYVGNVLNAADLAQRRNDQAAEPHRESLERLLVPEAYP